MVGAFIIPKVSTTYAQDILIEANAEVEDDATDKLRTIQCPVLMLCGDHDFYFPKEYIEEMAAMIPNAQLKLYPGKGHLIFSQKAFPIDIKEFLAKN